MRQLLDDGLDLAPGVTFLVGENGSGKSTLVEAVAAAYGLNPEGGSTGARHRTRSSESPLADVLRLVRSPGPLVASYFLRAETMHGLFTYLEDNPSADLRREGSQVLCATHSPLLASLPGATLLECGDHGLRESV